MNRAADLVAERLSREFNVSRETLSRLAHYETLLRTWQRSINLVSPTTLDDIWSRHFLDSAQLISSFPTSYARCIDIGSGAGFPALVLAILMRGDSNNAHWTLVESNSKKAAFLRIVVSELSLRDVEIRNARAEDAIQQLPKTDVITARALAPLGELIEMINPLLKTGARAIFPKGRDASNELTTAQKNWQFYSQSTPSITDPKAQIITLWM